MTAIIDVERKLENFIRKFAFKKLLEVKERFPLDPPWTLEVNTDSYGGVVYERYAGYWDRYKYKWNNSASGKEHKIPSYTKDLLMAIRHLPCEGKSMFGLQISRKYLFRGYRVLFEYKIHAGHGYERNWETFCFILEIR